MKFKLQASFPCLAPSKAGEVLLQGCKEEAAAVAACGGLECYPSLEVMFFSQSRISLLAVPAHRPVIQKKLPMVDLNLHLDTIFDSKKGLKKMLLFDIQKEDIGKSLGIEYLRSKTSCCSSSSENHARRDQKNGLLQGLP